MSPSEKTSASVAFRLKRPYGSEDELIAGDGHGIRKSGMMLFGAAPRPVGMIVRFEIALRDGTPLFRGEGKVIAHHASPEPGHPGALQVKFTRLDPHGKWLVDHAVARNEGRPPPSTRSPLSLPPPSRDSGPASIAPQSIIPSPPESFSLDIGVTVVDPAEAAPVSERPSLRGDALVIPGPPRLPGGPLLGRPREPDLVPDTSETDLSNTRVADTVVAAVPEALPTPVVPLAALGSSPPDEAPPTVQEHTVPLELSRPKTLVPSVDLDIPVHIEIEADDPTLALAPRGTLPSIDVEIDFPPSRELDEPTIAISREKLAPRENEALPAFEAEPSSHGAAGPLPPVVVRASMPALAPTPTPAPVSAIDPDGLPTPEEQTMRLAPKSAPPPSTRRSLVPAALAATTARTEDGGRDALLARLRARRGESTSGETPARDPAALERLRGRTAPR